MRSIWQSLSPFKVAEVADLRNIYEPDDMRGIWVSSILALVDRAMI